MKSWPVNKSKPGQKLSPELNAVILPIYKRDPVRYARLCLWVWRQQKYGATDESIIKAVELAGERIHMAPDWFAYLTKLMPKASARAHEEENDGYKKADLTQVGAIMRKITGT